MFPSVSVVVGGFFKIMENRDFEPRVGPKNRLIPKILQRKFLGTRLSSGGDILTQSSIKGPSIAENYVQLLWKSTS